MSQNNKKQQSSKKAKIKSEDDAIKNEELFPSKVEKVYKIILRSMSWIVGSALILVILLFYFNSPVVDQYSQVIFYIGIVTLVVFIVIELVSVHFKRLLSKFLKE